MNANHHDDGFFFDPNPNNDSDDDDWGFLDDQTDQLVGHDTKAPGDTLVVAASVGGDNESLVEVDDTDDDKHQMSAINFDDLNDKDFLDDLTDQFETRFTDASDETLVVAESEAEFSEALVEVDDTDDEKQQMVGINFDEGLSDKKFKEFMSDFDNLSLKPWVYNNYVLHDGLVDASTTIKNRHTIRTRVDMARNLSAKRVESAGRRRELTLDSMMCRSKFTRSPDQVGFTEAFKLACVKMIYAEEFARQKNAIFKRYGIDHIDPWVLVTTPRRWGKTECTAIFAAAALIAIPGIHMSIYSTGSRASRSITDKVRGHVAYMTGNVRRIVRSNQEETYVCTEAVMNDPDLRMEDKIAHETTSRLYSYPGSKTGTVCVC